METYITLADLPTLQTAYDTAIEAGQEQFTIVLQSGKEAELYTPYAKYLIQYLNDQQAN